MLVDSHCHLDFPHLSDQLDDVLARPSLRQLKQRLTFSYELKPLDRIQLEGFVTYRLASAGCERQDLFTPGALDAMHRGSRGIARLVAILGHKALMAAFGRGDHSVNRSHVRQAIKDTEGAGRWRVLRRSRERSLLAGLRAWLRGLSLRHSWGPTQ